MRIAHYMTGLWKGGGVAAYVSRVTRGLRDAGHEVFLLDRRDCAPADPARAAAEPVTYVDDDAALLRVAAERGADLLHVHALVDAPGHAGAAAVPMIRTLHNHEPYCPSGTRFLGRPAVACDRRYTLLGCAWGHLADGCGSRRPLQVLSNFRRTWAEGRALGDAPVITVSEFCRRQMLRAGYAPDRLHELPIFAPHVADVTPAPDGPPRFLFLGRLTALKGVDWLLRAIAAANVPLHVDVAGDGNPRDEAAFRQLSADLGLGDRVTFHGWVNPRQVDALLRDCRALIFPSLWHEPSGTGVVEAAAHGRAAVVSRVGGTPEYVTPNETGLIVEPNDVGGLARAIERLATDLTFARALGAAGRQRWTDRYTPERHLEGLMPLYRRYARAAAGSAGGR